MITSNQAIGLKKNKVTTKTYVFTKAEFQQDMVPLYACDMKEFVNEDGIPCVSYSCIVNQFGEPVFKEQN